MELCDRQTMPTLTAVGTEVDKYTSILLELNQT